MKKPPLVAITRQPLLFFLRLYKSMLILQWVHIFMGFTRTHSRRFFHRFLTHRSSSQTRISLQTYINSTLLCPLVGAQSLFRLWWKGNARGERDEIMTMLSHVALLVSPRQWGWRRRRGGIQFRFQRVVYESLRMRGEKKWNIQCWVENIVGSLYWMPTAYFFLPWRGWGNVKRMWASVTECDRIGAGGWQRNAEKFGSARCCWVMGRNGKVAESAVYFRATEHF